MQRITSAFRHSFQQWKDWRVEDFVANKKEIVLWIEKLRRGLAQMTTLRTYTPFLFKWKQVCQTQHDCTWIVWMHARSFQKEESKRSFQVEIDVGVKKNNRRKRLQLETKRVVFILHHMFGCTPLFAPSCRRGVNNYPISNNHKDDTSRNSSQLLLRCCVLRSLHAKTS